MATYKITSGTASSPFILPSKIDSATTFEQSTAGADTLTVDADAFLISTGAYGALLGETKAGAWTVSIAGQIFGHNTGLSITATTGKVTVTADGSISSDEGGLSYSGNSFTLSNSGIISGGSFGPAVSFSALTSKIDNFGDMVGDVVNNAGASNDTFTNSGEISGSVLLSHGTNKVTNSGEIGGMVGLGDGADIVTNTGYIGQQVYLGSGANSLTNSKSASIGVDDNNLSILGGSLDDKISNDGTMGGTVYLQDGTNSLNNTGSVGGDNESNLSYIGGSGKDTVTNKGSMSGGLLVGTGSNSVDNTGHVGGFNGGGLSNVSVLSSSGPTVTTNTIKNSKTFDGGVVLESGTNSLTNSGFIGMEGGNQTSYLAFDGDDTVINSATGAMAGGVVVGKGNNSLNNAGEIGYDMEGWSYYAYDIGTDKVTNTKRLFGAVALGDGSNSLTNSGSIGQDTSLHLAVFGGNDDDTVTNTDFIGGKVQLGEGKNAFFNTGGTVESDSFFVSNKETNSRASYVGGSEIDDVTSTGQLVGYVHLGDGTNSFKNSGNVGVSYNTSAEAVEGFSVIAYSGNDTINNSGFFSGGVNLGEGNNKLVNSGTVQASNLFDGVSYIGGSGKDDIDNSKNINGWINLEGGTNSVKNSGYVGRDDNLNWSILAGPGDDTITNNNWFDGGVSLGDGKNSLVNTKHIGESATELSYSGGQDNDTVNNSGEMSGGVALGDAIDLPGLPVVKGQNLLTNSGQIYGDVAGGAHKDIIDNKASGLIDGSVSLFDGANSFTNAGRLAGDLTTGDDGDTIKNTGGTIMGAVSLGGGADTFTNTGSVNGIIDLGAGDDKFTGGNFAETVKDGAGFDKVNLGGGDDRYISYFDTVNDVSETVDGGAGIDTYDGGDSGTQLFINLSSKLHMASNFTANGGTNFEFFSAAVTATMLNYGNIVGNASETVLGFENIIGSNQADLLAGSDVANSLFSNAGTDDLWGFGGNDYLDGGADADEIVGGLGADVLVGGTGDDDFYYFDVKDSGVTIATRDRIDDFVVGAGGDRINLSAIDANTLVGGNDAFTFIGTNVVWGGSAGELRAFWTAYGQIIEGDVNGDKKADFSIFITDPSHHLLSGADGVDFIL